MNRAKSPVSTARATRSALIAAASFLAAAAVVAGPLNPPAGPVMSSYKTLSEVEPRTAISAVNTPGDASSVFRITQPGSYYLTGDLQGVSGKSGIVIASPDVSIDLNGFRIQGVTGAGSGIRTSVPMSRITIRNGMVRGFPGDGISLIGVDPSADHRIENVLAESNGSGILVGDRAIVRSCSSNSNGFSGISAGTGSMVESCIASGNGTRGIVVGDRSSVLTCVSTSNNGAGIIVFNESTVADCSVSSNGLSGISVFSSRCVIRGNTCTSNGAAGDGAGIAVSFGPNRIEGNNCTSNDAGIRVTAGGNFIARNTCSSNTLNWSISAGNVCLVVNAAAAGAAINGNAGGVSPGSSDPNANFTY